MKDLEEMKAHNICLNMIKQEADTDETLTETFIRQVHQVMLREDCKRSIVNFRVEKLQVILFMPVDIRHDQIR